MTHLISEREVVGVRLLTLELSEGELEVLVSCLNYVRSHVDNQVLEQLTGAYPDEVEAIDEDLRQWLEQPNQKCSLSQRSKRQHNHPIR